MGQGLGKNSPVKLSLGRENYEALIERHGQWIRWRTATKCACVNARTYQPDIHCKKCGGRGWIYGYQSEMITQCVVQDRHGNGVLELEKDYESDTLVKVYDRDGVLYEAEKNGIFVFLSSASTEKNHYYNVTMERTIAKSIDEATMTKEGNYWKVSGVESEKSTIDGVYYTAPGDILSIGTITDAEGETFEVESMRLNLVVLKKKYKTDEEGKETEEEIEPVEPLTASSVSYIPPFVFALLNQNLSKGDFAAMTDAQGDAVCTYPYFCDVSDSDVLTVLAGTTTKKDIMTRTSNDTDILPVYFVAEVSSIFDSNGTEYENGVDFILTGTNEIKWLSDYLSEGDAYSVTYKVYPTYVVAKDIPQLRSSENQRFPKKCVVKYMSTYSEKRGVQKN